MLNWAEEASESAEIGLKGADGDPAGVPGWPTVSNIVEMIVTKLVRTDIGSPIVGTAGDEGWIAGGPVAGGAGGLAGVMGLSAAGEIPVEAPVAAPGG